MASLPVAVITMENGDIMKLELYPDNAPITTDNFIQLAQSGYYDNLSFHRVVKDYVIQGGSKTNTCTGDYPGFTISGEFKENGHDTQLGHPRGALSMARSDDLDSAATQFFIVHKDAHKLDGRYASFGLLIEGFSVLDNIATTLTKPPEEENRPIVKQTIKAITIERNGYKPENAKRLLE